jgi:hypothetical protein
MLIYILITFYGLHLFGLAFITEQHIVVIKSKISQKKAS